MSDGKAEAFNTYTTNWFSRIDSMNNSIILVVGGVMGITIGAFLGSKPLSLDALAVSQIRLAWILLAISLICAILVKFTLVVSGAITLKQWEQKIQVGKDGRIIVDSPKWVHVVAWTLAVTSVFSCVFGFALISIGAGSLL